MTKPTDLCPRCQGTRWSDSGLCFSCESQPQRAAIADSVAAGRSTIAEAHESLDELEATPYLFWDTTLEVYGYEDGDEQGVCLHATTTDVLDMLGEDKVPTLAQLHGLGDDWGFRTATFVDKRGREHTLHLETYKHPSCFEEYGGVSDETRATLERIQTGVLRRVRA